MHFNTKYHHQKISAHNLLHNNLVDSTQTNRFPLLNFLQKITHSRLDQINLFNKNISNRKNENLIRLWLARDLCS